MSEATPLVGIIMGSESDMPAMEPCMKQLEEFGIPYEVKVASAHRKPAEVHAVDAVHPAVLEEYDDGHDERGRHLVEHPVEEHAQRPEGPGEEEVDVRHLEDAHARREAGVGRHEEHQREVADSYRAELRVRRGLALPVLAGGADEHDEDQQRYDNNAVYELGRGAEYALEPVLERG